MSDLTMTEVIRKAIEGEISRIVQEEANSAGNRAEQRVRESTGAICSRVLQHFRLEMFGGSELRITVDFKNTKT